MFLRAFREIRTECLVGGQGHPLYRKSPPHVYTVTRVLTSDPYICDLIVMELSYDVSVKLQFSCSFISHFFFSLNIVSAELYLPDLYVKLSVD